MNYLKKFTILILILSLIIVPVATIEVRAEDTPTFGAGYNNMAESDGKVVAVLTAVFASMGLEGGFLLAAGTDTSKAELWSRKLLGAVRQVDSSIFDYINTNTVIDFSSVPNSAVVRFVNGARASHIPSLTELIEYLFGQNALSGDPINTTIQGDRTINLGGKSVIPWAASVPFSTGSFSDRILDVNDISARGEFLIPYDGAYGTFYNSIKNNWNNAVYGYNYQAVKNDGSTYNLNTGLYRAGKGNTSPYGNYQLVKIVFQGSGNVATTETLIWRVTDNSENLIFAFMPVVDSNNKLCLAIYSYVYSGNEIPSGWGTSNYTINWVNIGQDVVYEQDTSEFTFTSPGLTAPISGDTITISSDNSINITNNKDIVNNYFENNITVDGDRDNDNSSPGGTVPDWGTGGDGGGINFPGINLPDLNIDWNISGLKDKFPFSIPWDLMAFFTVLNAPPETPRIQGDIDFGVYVWELDYSLEQFDNIAALLRNLEFVGFCLGLILATRRLIGG